MEEFKMETSGDPTLSVEAGCVFWMARRVTANPKGPPAMFELQRWNY